MSDLYQIDSHKLIYHPERVASLKAVGTDWEKAKHVYPIYLELSPIGACNHRCTFCAVDYVGYKPDRLSIEMMRERLPEFARLGVKSVNFAGEGEPMLHKNIAEMIHLAKEAGLDASLTTNAAILPKDFLDEALPHLSWIKISLNAGSAETYAKVHRTKAEDFNKALDHIARMTERRRAKGLRCTLGAQILLLPENAHEIENLARICRDQLGIDYLVVKPFSQHLASENTAYRDIDYSKWFDLGKILESYSTDKFNVIFRSHTMKKYMEADHGYTHCYSTPFLWGHVMATGIVSGCSAYLLNDLFEFGNLNEQTFEQVWTGDKRKRNFEFVTNELDITNCRKNCRMDEVNRYLFKLIEKQPPHVNFI